MNVYIIEIIIVSRQILVMPPMNYEAVSDSHGILRTHFYITDTFLQGKFSGWP